MPASFPTSPTVGQTYTYNGVTWIYRSGGYWDVSSSGSAANVYDTATASTGYFDLPSGTTAQRPSNPPSGAIRYNSTGLNVEYYDPVYQRWMAVDKIPLDSSGVLNSFGVDYLIIAGGGGGGSHCGGNTGSSGGLGGGGNGGGGQLWLQTLGII